MDSLVDVDRQDRLPSPNVASTVVSGMLLMSYTAKLPTRCDLRHQLGVGTRAGMTSNGEEVKEKQHFYRNGLF